MKHLNLVLALTLCFGLIVTNSYCADEWLKTRPASTDQKIDYPTAVTANNTAIDRLLTNYREGMMVYYGTASEVTIGEGEVVCSNAGGSLKKFRHNPSTTTVRWTEIDTGAEASSTAYFIYAIADADAATVTFLISASSSAPTGATYYKKIAAFYNNSSGNIEQIVNLRKFSVPNGGVENARSAPSVSTNSGPTAYGDYYYLTMGLDSVGTLRTISGYASSGTAIPLPDDCEEEDSHWVVSIKKTQSSGHGWNATSIEIESDRTVKLWNWASNWVN